MRLDRLLAKRPSDVAFGCLRVRPQQLVEFLVVNLLLLLCLGRGLLFALLYGK